jgi:hypothetical protein
LANSSIRCGQPDIDWWMMRQARPDKGHVFAWNHHSTRRPVFERAGSIVGKFLNFLRGVWRRRTPIARNQKWWMIRVGDKALPFAPLVSTSRSLTGFQN